jgi:hypothetical protein
MPIDPSIVGQLKTPSGPTPFELTGQLLQFQGLKQQLDANDLKLKDAERDRADQDALDAAFTKSGGDRAAFLANVPGHLRRTLETHYADLDAKTAILAKSTADTTKTNLEIAGLKLDAAGALAAKADELGSTPLAMAAMFHEAKRLGLDVTAEAQQLGIDPAGDILAQLKAIDPSALAQVNRSVMQASKEQRKLLDDHMNAQTSAATQQATAANNARDDVRADRQLTEVERHNKESEALQRLNAQGGGGLTGNAQVQRDDAKVIAQGIKDGTISPDVLISARTTAGGMALQAALKNLGVDSNKITREWIATKQAIRSLNNTGQLRLAQVINKASASLEKLDELNQEWSKNATRWGIKALNRASLSLAENGTYGPEAASVATRLKAQIADVTSELGQGIMGGNSPTDHALKLAAHNLNSEWTDKVLGDAIKQVRYNLNLAQNARNEILEGLGVESTQVQTPTAGSTTEVPADVKSALANVPAGTYSAPDGTKWVKGADGSIKKAGG